jgi:hypothetical protein
VDTHTQRRGGASMLGTSVEVHHSSSEHKQLVTSVLLLLSVSLSCVCLWWWVGPCGRSIGMYRHSTKLCVFNQRVNRDQSESVGGLLLQVHCCGGVRLRGSARGPPRVETRGCADWGHGRHSTAPAHEGGRVRADERDIHTTATKAPNKPDPSRCV